MSAVTKRDEIRSEREEKRIAGNLSNAMLPKLRAALDEAVNAGAHVVVGEVVEADAHAEESIAKYRDECNERIREANARMDKSETAHALALEAERERTKAAKKERDAAMKMAADERERRIIAEEEIKRLNKVLSVVRSQVKDEE